MDREQLEASIKRIFETVSETGLIKSREGNSLEFKESFSKGGFSKYAKTMASFANHKGGFIIFGVSDKPRKIKGLQSDCFDTFEQERFTESLNSFFEPAIEWECGSLEVRVQENMKKIGWIYTYEAENKPVIAQKSCDSEKFYSGDILYRYRAVSQKIKYAEMHSIISECARLARERLLKLIETVHKSGTANLGIVNYSNGKFSTPYGVDVEIDRKLVKQVLKKAKFIKEGCFSETEGAPVIKVTGNIDLAEEVPVPDSNPDESHPYIQKKLAEMLNISAQDLYALIFYYKMKEARKYHIEITTSKHNKVHKFSSFAFEFLSQKLEELSKNEDEFNKIRQQYKNRNK